MQRFNIRVYGILINEQKQLLVCDELIRGKQYTKFPGGGLEFGEGTRDCLVREFVEEMDLQVRVGEHLYTTDYFQPSAFHPDHQIISIYYLVHPLEKITVRLSTTPFDYQEEHGPYTDAEEAIIGFRFIDLAKLTEEMVTLPIDKIVISLLLTNATR